MPFIPPNTAYTKTIAMPIIRPVVMSTFKKREKTMPTPRI